MNTTQLKCFLSVGHTLNFTVSGQELFLSQSTVSKNIKNLEKELGVTLIGRAYHRVFLTEPGKVFFNRMTAISAEIDEVVESVQRGTLIDRPTVRMGYTDLPFEKKWLPIALRLANLHTHAQLVPHFVDPGRERHISDLISDGVIDIMLIQRDIMNNTAGTQYLELFRKGFSLVVPENDPLFFNDTIDLGTLVGRIIYLWNGDANFPAIESLKYDLTSHQPNISYVEENDSSTLIAYVRAKMGLGIVPSVLYNKADTDLHYIPINTDQQLSYGIVYPTDSDRAELIAALNHQIKLAVNQAKNDF
ncbi:LysR family transcriptional regulator [Lacticaseibacillus nasuensis]|uniref:LysR family transcriptional regulator n=1 Tax=Lacticaseibacillus nasuensis TaxID=944671 RepID=UPI002246FC76|nr:LysR family transcriptional regulator [Lacticaseibacillus nasuensis]MCX2455529.1 LysR family transcriptional regulator [Lacticaseibacillus nasuensis]